MTGLRIPRAHSNDWYDHLVTLQEGYYYPWESVLDPRNGAQAFEDMVMSSLSEDTVVLEVGCGHGELALQVAQHCKKVIAYDRVPEYISIARQKQKVSGISNLEFLVHDAMNPTEDGVALPAEDSSIDLVICRLGPHHWIEDAGRICSKGAQLIQLSPMEEPIPAWSSILPHAMHYENSGRHSGAGSIHQSVDNRLHQAGLTLHGGWSFDVPEVFSSHESLYQMVTWGLPPSEIPGLDDVSDKFAKIFDRFAEPDGVVLRHCRYLWTAFIR